MQNEVTSEVRPAVASVASVPRGGSAQPVTAADVSCCRATAAAARSCSQPSRASAPAPPPPPPPLPPPRRLPSPYYFFVVLFVYYFVVVESYTKLVKHFSIIYLFTGILLTDNYNLMRLFNK